MMEAGLPDELLLLALHDEKGSVIPAAAPVLNGVLIGAALMELSLQGRLRENSDRTLTVDPTPTDDLVLDRITAQIASVDPPREAPFWVDRLSRQLPDLKDRLLERLVANGVLERRDRRILWVFPSRRFPLADAVAEQQARDRIRAVILDGQEADRRTAALIALVQACNLIDEIFAPHERPQARRRIVELTSDEQTTASMFGDTLDSLLLAALVGATTIYAYHQLNRVGGDDAYVGSASTTDWGSSAPVSSESSESGGGWFGSSWFSGSADNANDNSSDSGGWDSGGSDFGGDSGSSGC